MTCEDISISMSVSEPLSCWEGVVCAVVRAFAGVFKLNLTVDSNQWLSYIWDNAEEQIGKTEERAWVTHQPMNRMVIQAWTDV